MQRIPQSQSDQEPQRTVQLMQSHGDKYQVALYSLKRSM